MIPNRAKMLMRNFSDIAYVNRRHRHALEKCERRRVANAYATVISARENFYYLAHQRRTAQFRADSRPTSD